MNGSAPYPFYLITVGMLLFLLSYSIIKQPRTYGRQYLAIILTLSGLMIIASAMELLAASETTMLWLRNFQQIPIYLTPIFFYGLAREFLEKPSNVTIKRMTWMMIPNLVFIVLVYTDVFHHFMRASITFDSYFNLTEMTSTPTLTSILFSAYTQIIYLTAIFLLIINLNNVYKEKRTQHWLFLIAFIIPVISYLLIPFSPFQLPAKVALSLSFTGLLLYFICKRYDLVSAWPIAKERIFETMNDGVLIFDRYKRLNEINHAATVILTKMYPGYTTSSFNNIYLKDIFKDQTDILKLVSNHQESKFSIEYPDKDLWIDGQVLPLRAEKFTDEATLIILSDVSKAKKAEQKLIERATIDQLTKTYNRYFFMENYYKWVKHQPQQQVLLIMDLDFFKQINDNYGHQAGDKALQIFGTLLKSYFEQNSIIGRFGGEEFAIYTNSELDVILDQVKKFQETLKHTPILTDNNQRFLLKISVGLSIAKGNGTTFEKLYKEADEALYDAKHSGRNRLVIYQDNFKILENVHQQKRSAP
ncbi:histidine kinase N-terminal 7TM domain-containing diguanylate cyclase [Saliterribacillus persicus]|uniref:Diguanylate cyclase (GGDEF)-like protein n=1 Tax=Saliterribacillus persicus TaxID=930114 RepID=A0A368X9N0_9BACI|nr:diguanylate cyclase [Saliterribacillus persicus]RCW62744.1 diguanylate cyclase (GGDEF)-like protein [Saliterribacillus persicus]